MLKTPRNLLIIQVLFYLGSMLFVYFAFSPQIQITPFVDPDEFIGLSSLFFVFVFFLYALHLLLDIYPENKPSYFKVFPLSPAKAHLSRKSHFISKPYAVVLMLSFIAFYFSHLNDMALWMKFSITALMMFVYANSFVFAYIAMELANRWSKGQINPLLFTMNYVLLPVLVFAFLDIPVGFFPFVGVNLALFHQTLSNEAVIILTVVFNVFLAFLNFSIYRWVFRYW